MSRDVKRDSQDGALSVNVGRISIDRPIDSAALSKAVEVAVTKAVTNNSLERSPRQPSHLGQISLTTTFDESAEASIANVIADLVGRSGSGE